MNKKRKICVVVMSRANYARVKSVLRAVQNHPNLELQLIVGASAMLHRFGNVKEIIERDGFKINAMVYLIIEGENPTTMAKSTGLAIIELTTLFENLKPDIILTVADRFETMSTAIASSYMNITLAHIQGGEVTGSIDESVRHAITKLAHIHFPATKLSKERLIKMGEDPSTVFLTGCPSIDLLNDFDFGINGFLEDYKGVGSPVDLHKPYLVVLQHPVTTEYGKGLRQINETLQAINKLEMPTIWFWPNVDAGSDEISKGLRVFREENRPDFIHFYINLAYENYIRLINNCACLAGNSSSAIREGSYLGVPAVNIGTRQSGRERGKNIIDVGYNHEEISDAIKKQIQNGKYSRETIYGDGKAGERIANILADCKLNGQKKLFY